MKIEQTSPIATSPSGASGKPPAPPSSPPAREEIHWGTLILVLLVIILGIGAFVILRSKKPKTPVLPPVSITVTNVRQGDIEVAVTALGSVQPVYTVSVSPRVDGQVMSVNYTEGQMVTTNDLLAVIDPGPYQAALTQATGQLARDKALLDGAKVDLDRYQAAYQKNAIQKQLYDDQIALVHQDEGTVKLDEGQFANAQVQLAYCYIHAPISGRVGLRLVDPGNVVHAANSNAMVVIAQLQPITVVFNVAEDYLPQIQSHAREDDPMTVEAYDRTQEIKIATGTVLALDNLIDSATGTIKLKAIFTNEDSVLFPNQFVNAKLIIETLHDANLVPTFAIQHNPEGAFVYVVTNDTITTNGMTTNFQAVTMRTVTPGTSDANVTAITQGLQPGEIIAVDNFNKLGEGVKVTPRKGDDATPSGGAKHKGGGHGKKPDDAKDSP